MTEKEMGYNQYPDNNVEGIVLVVDLQKHTYWLTMRDNSVAMLQGKIGEATFHYKVPRGAEFDGYFTGTLHIPVKVPFSKAKYSPILGEILTSINNSQSKTEGTKMQNSNVTDAEFVEETQAVANSRPPSTLITTIEKDGKKLDLYHYDPVKHAKVKNPKKDIPGMSRKDRRYWNNERDKYMALMNHVESQTEEKIKPSSVETIPPTKEEKINQIPKTVAPKACPVSNMVKGYLDNLVGNSAELLTVEELSLENAAFLGFLKNNVWNLLQFPVLEKDVVIFISFPKESTAKFWLEEMRKVPSYREQLTNIEVVPRSRISQTIAKDATLMITNVKELLERLHKPKKEV